MSDRSKTEERSRPDGWLHEDFKRSRGRTPSWRGIPFADYRLAPQIMAASNFVSHAHRTLAQRQWIEAIAKTPADILPTRRDDARKNRVLMTPTGLGGDG